MYRSNFDESWPSYFNSLENSFKERVAKKIKNILAFPQKRHFKGANFFVAEIGQYRLIYRIFEEIKEVRFYFVGDHKEYEKWYKQLF